MHEAPVLIVGLTVYLKCVNNTSAIATFVAAILAAL